MSTRVFEKICPLCSTSNEPNAIICRHCGAHIELRPNVPTIRLADNSFEVTQEAREGGSGEYVTPPRGISLFLLNKGEPIALRMDQEFILGRAGETATSPMVDFTEYDGFGMGISRCHAMIRAVGEKYVLIDLNSSNGTWLDGRRLVPNKPYDLPNGTVIQLGRLKVIVSYLHPVSAKQANS